LVRPRIESSRPKLRRGGGALELLLVLLKAQIGADLPVEPELERWFPLWGIPV